MSKSIESQLIDEMAYGSVTRSDIPGDIQNYDVVLVRQVIRIRKQEQTRFKLKFTPKMKKQDEPFSLSIDLVRTPANSLFTLKYQEIDNERIISSVGSKITKKMVLTVQKNKKLHQDISYQQESEQGSEDSDIPKKRLFFDEEDSSQGRPRKAKNLGYTDGRDSDE